MPGILKEMAHKLNLKNISFEGFQEPEPYYARSSLFCLTSTFEGFGLVLAEAMQHGCVPLAFDSYPGSQRHYPARKNGGTDPAIQ